MPIGEGTTDLAITNGLIYDPSLNLGLNNGIGYPIERGIEEIRDIIGIRDISRQEISNIMQNPNHKFYTIVYESIYDYLKDETHIIMRNIKSLLESINYDVDIIVIYGGGSILMKELLFPDLKEICDRTKISLYYTNPEFAIRIEADGLFDFTKSDIFEDLKPNGVIDNMQE